MVHVARNALDLAAREVDDGLAVVEAEIKAASRLLTVALYWLKGLLCLARGAIDDAMAAFDRELALEGRGHFYARECAANTWYAKGVCYLRRDMFDEARDAFGEAIARVPLHPGALAGLRILECRESGSALQPEHVERPTDGAPLAFESHMAHAALLVDAGNHAEAVKIVEAALAAAAPGSTGWTIPIDPLLLVTEQPEAWTPVLATLHVRAR